MRISPWVSAPISRTVASECTSPAPWLANFECDATDPFNRVSLTNDWVRLSSTGCDAIGRMDVDRLGDRPHFGSGGGDSS